MSRAFVGEAAAARPSDEDKRVVWSWAGILATLGLGGALATSLLSTTIVLLPLLALALAGVIRSRELLWDPRNRAAFALLGVLSVLLAVLTTVQFSPLALSRWMVVSRLEMVLVGWTLVLWLPLRQAPPTARTPAWTPGRWHIFALLGVTLAFGAGRHLYGVGGFAVLQDEALYLLQSRWMSQPGFGWQIAPELVQFLRPEYTFYDAGVLTTQYPPGWPALIAAFSSLGLRWWSTPLLVVAAVGFTFLLGRELRSPVVGLVAAVLVALQTWVLDSAQGYMSHAASLAAVTAGAYLLIRGEARAGWPGLIAWIGAGFALAAAVAIRPLSGVAMTVSLCLWLLVRRRLDTRGLRKLATGLLLGAVVPVGALLHYNRVTNGHPLVFGYQAVHGELHDLGFGPRGYRYYGGELAHSSVAARPFTPGVAVANLGDRAWDFVAGSLPLFLLVPLLWVGIVHRFEFQWSAIAAFLVLPAAYFFYFFTSIRFYTELVPFLAVGIALMVTHVAQRDSRLFTRFLLPLIIVASLPSATLPDVFQRRAREAVLPRAQQLKDTATDHGRIVVFIRETREAYLFRRLSLFNEHGLSGDIIVARDRGPANRILIQRLPDHVPFLGMWDGPTVTLRLERLPGRDQ